MLSKVHRLVADPAAVPAAVVVVGEDAVVGQALELLLRSTKYSVRFVALPSFSARRSLDGAQLLLLAPGLEPGDREAILLSVGAESDAPNLPVVELVSAAQASRVGASHFVVPWPCRLEDLEQRIRAALSLDASREQYGYGASRTLKDGKS